MSIRPSPKPLRMLVGIIIIAALWVTNPATAAVIRVPQDYQTIQGGIDQARSGDEVIVSPGYYVENLQYGGKNIVVRSTDPNNAAVVDTTIIDGNVAAPAVTFNGTESADAVLAGFTVINGTYGIDGRNDSAHNPPTQATIRNNVISNNSSTGIVWCSGSILYNTISNNGWGGLNGCDGTIAGNSITWNAHGGIQGCGGLITANVISDNYEYNGRGIQGCSAIIRNNIITHNDADYGAGLSSCSGDIQNNIIAWNTSWRNGAGLYNCSGTIENNAIFENSTGSGREGGGLDDCNGLIRNCIIWGNRAGVGAQLNDSSVPTFSCIQDWTGGGIGNISAQPLFLNAANVDFHLQSGSPCIDTGAPGGLFNDGCLPPGRGTVRNDMGAYGGPNNCDWLSPAEKPDVKVTEGSVAPLQGGQGNTVQVSLTIKNTGGSVSPPNWIQVYLSADEVQDTGDHVWIQGILAPQLAAGETYSYSTSTLTPSLTPGEYHVLIECDTSDAIDEPNETDNLLDAGVFTILEGPDLIGRSCYISQINCYPQQIVTVSLRVENIGDMTAGANWVHVYLSSNQVYDGSDYVWLSGVRVRELLPSDSFEFQKQLVVPDVPAGRWYMLLQCDVGNEVAEFRESNNVRPSPAFWIHERTPAKRWPFYR